jgi:catechol 2,3-dioxygenase-like lactoylglutathione lyase family enzyme
MILSPQREPAMTNFYDSMIDHLNIGVSNAQRSKAFYQKVLQPLGYDLIYSIPREGAEVGGEQEKAGGVLHGFGLPHKPLFWILGDVPVGKGMHIAFTAKTRAQVDAFYVAALAAGATDNGPPGIRRYHPNYYGAFVFDPDGINIEAVCHAPE